MSQSIGCSRTGLRWLVLAGFLACQGGLVPAQEGKIKSPESRFAFDLAARKAGEEKFSKETKKYGVEVFLDPNSNKLIYISEAGAISVVPAPATLPAGKSKDPEWQHAMELRVRKVGEKDFVKEMTKKYSLEVFRDENTGNLIYICETGSIAVVPGGSAPLSKSKTPEWKHAMELKARKAGEKEFDNAKKHAVEVFRDENTGNLVYITDVGNIAVLSGAPVSDGKANPTWKHAMEVKVRKGGDPDFNEKTPKFGVEVFQDSNTGKLIYLSETGMISVPAGLTATSKDKGPEWKYGLDVKARKAGETEWGTAKRYGLEIYLDENTGGLMYICETGSLTALPK
jgi:hypothetical protein